MTSTSNDRFSDWDSGGSESEALWFNHPIYRLDTYERLETVRTMYHNVWIFSALLAVISIVCVIAFIEALIIWQGAGFQFQFFTGGSAAYFLYLAVFSVVIGQYAKKLNPTAFNLSIVCACTVLAPLLIALGISAFSTKSYGFFAYSTRLLLLSVGALVYMVVHLRRIRLIVKKTYEGLISDGQFESQADIDDALEKTLYTDKLISSRINRFAVEPGTRADELETKLIREIIADKQPAASVESVKNDMFRSAMREYMEFQLFLGTNICVIGFYLIIGWLRVRDWELFVDWDWRLVGYAFTAATLVVFFLRRQIQLLYRLFLIINIVEGALLFPLFYSMNASIRGATGQYVALGFFIVVIGGFYLSSLLSAVRQRRAKRVIESAGVSYDYPSLERFRVMYSLILSYMLSAENAGEDGWQ